MDILHLCRVAADCNPKEGETLYYVPLAAAAGTGEVIHLLSTQIYCFGSHTLPPRGIHSPPASAPPALLSGGMSLPLTTPLQGSGPAVSVAVSTSTPLASAAEGVAPIGSGQLISAVRDLLSAAGLPLDLERSVFGITC